MLSAEYIHGHTSLLVHKVASLGVKGIARHISVESYKSSV